MMFDWVNVNLMGTYIIIIGAIFGFSIIKFMSLRNNWVFKKRSNWRESLHVYILHNQDKFDYYDNIYGTIGSYSTMYTKFWIWNLRDFVKDENKDKFDEIMLMKKNVK